MHDRLYDKEHSILFKILKEGKPQQ